MVMLAKATDEEMKQAADYFSAVKWRSHVKVETNLVPATRIQGELFIPTVNHVTEHKLTEPIGNRIIEVPTDVDAESDPELSRGPGSPTCPLARSREARTWSLLAAHRS